MTIPSYLMSTQHRKMIYIRFDWIWHMYTLLKCHHIHYLQCTFVSPRIQLPFTPFTSEHGVGDGKSTHGWNIYMYIDIHTTAYEKGTNVHDNDTVVHDICAGIHDIDAGMHDISKTMYEERRGSSIWWSGNNPLPFLMSLSLLRL